MTDTQPNIAADRLRALIARLPDASHVMCAVADLNEVLQELDEVTDFDRSALKTQELRDERERAVRGWHKEKKRADQAEAELGRPRQAIVDADGEAAAESIRADVAEAQRDQAREIAYAYRRAPSAIRIPWSNPDASLVELADEIVLSVIKIDTLPEWLTSRQATAGQGGAA